MPKIYRWFLTILLACVVTACSDNKSEVSSGGGGSGVVSDGGANSAQYAGTYIGEITTILSGGTFDGEQTTETATIVIRSNGTASLTIQGNAVEGTVNGNRFGFSIRIKKQQDFLECEGDAIISGILDGNALSGNVTGSGECELIAADTSFNIGGSLMAARVD
jgi:hypothetical protein